MNNESNNQVELATNITVAWLSNPNTRVGVDEIPVFLEAVYGALGALTKPASDKGAVDTGAVEAAEEYTRAVSVRKSLADPNYIISMIDGRPYKTLKRHLAGHGLSPDEYRARYGLKADYPITAPAYTEARKAMAKQLGLGRKPAAKAMEQVQPASKSRKGKSVADARAAAKAHLEVSKD